MQPEPGERFHAERQQRFADVKSRKRFAFEYNHPPSGPGEQCRSRAAGRSASYDGHIENAAPHRFDLSKLSKACRSKKRSSDTRTLARDARLSPTAARHDSFMLRFPAKDEVDRPIC